MYCVIQETHPLQTSMRRQIYVANTMSAVNVFYFKKNTPYWFICRGQAFGLKFFHQTKLSYKKMMYFCIPNSKSGSGISI